MKPLQAWFAALTLLTGPAVAWQAPLIPRHVLFGNAEKLRPQVSPDGKLLAYIAPYQGVRNVWVRTIGASDDRAVTREAVRPIREYYWQPDNSHILYPHDAGGTEDFHVYRTDLSSGKTEDLTPFEKISASVVAVDPQHPDEMLIQHNKRNPELFDVYRYHFKTGSMELDTENPGGVMFWYADHNLVVRAGEVILPDAAVQMLIRETAKSPWKTLFKVGSEENVDLEGFTPSNDSILLATSVDSDTERLLEMEISSGKVKRVIAEDPQYDAGNFTGNVLIHPRTHAIQAVKFVRARADWQVLDPGIQADFTALSKINAGDISVLSRDVDDRIWTVQFQSDDSASVFYLYDRAAKRAQFLFSEIPALAPYNLAKTLPISYSARDGMRILGYLTMPVGVARNAPTIMLVHGGPWDRDTWGFKPVVQLLANRGYAVIQPNFRGSIGYGKTYWNAGDREWAGKMQTDLLDAKDWAVHQGYSDPKKFCIMGGSYGGYATLVAVTFTPDVFTCGIDMVGPSNLVTLLRTIPPYWASMKAMYERRVGSLKDEDFLRSRSPLFKADRIRVPLLIAQGANDPRVKQAESDQIVRAIRDSKKAVEYIVFPDEGHGFQRPENNLRFYAAVEQFLAKYLGGRVEPPAAAEKWDGFLH